MATQIYTPKTGEFEFGSRVASYLLLVSFALGLFYLIYSLPRFLRGDRQILLAFLFGLLVVSYCAWREARGFFLARVTPTEVELQFLFGSERLSRKHVAGLELKVETYVPLSLDEGRWRQREASSHFRVVLTTRSGHMYVSARFDDEKQFFGLRDTVAEPPET